MKHFANAFNVQCVYILGEISRINFYGNKHLKTMNMKTMKKYFLLFFEFCYLPGAGSFF